MRTHTVVPRSNRRWILGAILAVALAGCGGEPAPPEPITDEELLGTEFSPPPTSTFSEQVQLDLGCTSDSPFTRTPASMWLGFITLCEHPDRVVIVNESTVILLVDAGPTGSLTLTSGPSPDTLTNDAVTQLRAAAVAPVGGHVRLVPGATATVRGAGGASQVRLGVDGLLTAQEYGTRAAAAYVEDKLKTPGRRIAGSIVGCGQAVGEFWDSEASGQQTPPSVQDALFTSIRTNLACKGMYTTVHQELSTQVPPPATVASEVRAAARGLGSTVLDDALSFAQRALAAVR